MQHQRIKVYSIVTLSIILIASALTPISFSTPSDSRTISSSGYIAIVAPPATSWLHVEGKNIKDAAGNIVLLRGAGRYEYTNDVAGTWNGVWTTFVENNVRQNLQEMKNWGMNNLRLQFNAEWWIQDYLNYKRNIKRTIEMAQDYGIYVMLDLAYIRSVEYYWNSGDNPWPGVPLAAYTSTAEKAIFPNDQAFYNFWGNVANELKVYPNVIFDIWNEPHAGTAQAWMNAVQQCINSIRATGSANLISVQWGYGVAPNFNDLSWIESYPLSDPTGNIVYNTHLYRYGYNQGWYPSWDYNTCVQSMRNCKFDYVVNTLQKPLIIGEIGASLYADNVVQEMQWARNIFKIANGWGIGYNAWAWSTGEYALTVSRTNFAPNQWGQALIDGIRG